MSDSAVVEDAADPRLDDYRRLNDQRFRRRFEGDELFIAEGFVAVERLVESDHVVRSALIAPSRADRFAATAETLAGRGVPVIVADRAVIADVVGFDLHRGVLASAERRPAPTLDDLLAGSRRLGVLEGLNDAENLGAIARAGRAFGLDGLVIDPTCTDPYSRRTVRVSMGEVLFLPIARASADEWRHLAERLHRVGVTTWAATPAADAASVWELPVPDRIAVCFGAEGPGLRRALLDTADHRVRIPIDPDVDSLNVAQAAAVILAAITRP